MVLHAHMFTNQVSCTYNFLLFIFYLFICVLVQPPGINLNFGDCRAASIIKLSVNPTGFKCCVVRPDTSNYQAAWSGYVLGEKVTNIVFCPCFSFFFKLC